MKIIQIKKFMNLHQFLYLIPEIIAIIHRKIDSNLKRRLTIMNVAEVKTEVIAKIRIK